MSNDHTVLGKSNNLSEKEKTKFLKEEWIIDSQNQRKFVENPEEVKTIEMVNGNILIPKLKIGGFSESGSIITVYSKKEAIIDQLEFIKYPHCVVALDKNNNLALNPMEYVMLKPEAIPLGEVQVGGINFFIFDIYSINLIIKDISKFMNQKEF